MARGSDTATNAAKTAAANSGTFMGNAGSLYGNLAPQLESQAANPQGFTPAEEAGMETAAEQSAGGTQAGAVGAGNLAAARTRNAGGFGKAVSDASRGAGETLSRNLLGIKNENAQMKERQRQAALGGLEGLYGTNVSGSNAALGNVAPNISANTAAENASWTPFNSITSFITNAANTGAKFA